MYDSGVSTPQATDWEDPFGLNESLASDIQVFEGMLDNQVLRAANQHDISTAELYWLSVLHRPDSERRFSVLDLRRLASDMRKAARAIRAIAKQGMAFRLPRVRVTTTSDMPPQSRYEADGLHDKPASPGRLEMIAITVDAFAAQAKDIANRMRRRGRSPADAQNAFILAFAALAQMRCKKNLDELGAAVFNLTYAATLDKHEYGRQRRRLQTRTKFAKIR